MEIPTELQQSITKAKQAVEKAQSDYDNMLAKNPTASVVDTDQHLKTTLKYDYETLARKEENLAQKEDLKRELLMQQTIILQRDQNQGISSILTAESASVTPEQVLKDLLDFDVGMEHQLLVVQDLQ